MSVCQGTAKAARRQVKAWHELLAGFGVQADGLDVTDVSVTNHGDGLLTVAITRKG